MEKERKTQKKVPTSKLLSKIFSTKNIRNFLTKNREHFYAPSLCEYLAELCAKKKMKPRDAVKNADIDRIYGAEIFSGKRVNPSRDYIIRLALGLRLDYNECQKLLDVARESRLYPRIPRDAVIISCLHDKLTYQQTEEKLYEMDLPILGARNENNQK